MTYLKRLLRLPFVHFMLIGAVIFLSYYALNYNNTPVSNPQEIVVTKQRAEQLAATFRSTWMRPPSNDELSKLIDGLVKQEVMVREAKALSLDKNDVVIRRRLSQKIRFLTTSAASAITPAEGELKQYFKANTADYASGEKIGFDQVYLGQSANAAAVEKVRAALASGADPGQEGRRSLLPKTMPLSQQSIINSTFGGGFFAQLKTLKQGIWLGPVRSGFGLHLVRINQHEAAKIPAFDTVKDAVLQNWREQKAKKIAAEQYARQLKLYTVIRPDRMAKQVPAL